MRNLPVHWAEGMYLRPQHFQAADRYWSELVQTSEHLDHAYNYGISRLEISPESLGNAQFQINVCHARMKDGTIVVMNMGQEPDRIDLREALSKTEAGLRQVSVDLRESLGINPAVQVFLAVPKLKLGAQNVASEANLTKQRYVEQQRQLQDETSGSSDQEVRLKNLNVRLLLSTQDISGYEVLPIAQIQRSGTREGEPRLDAKYFPPMLDIGTWPALARDVMIVIYDTIGKKIETLSQQVVHRGNTLISDEPGDLDRVLMLQQLNEAYSRLRVTAFAKGMHPLVAYHELCGIVGKLSLFGSDRRAEEPPLYDHDDLATIFYWAKAKIDQLLDSGPRDEYEQRPFIGAGLGMQVTLEDRWLNTDWKWFVGVQHENINEEECAELLQSGGLDWKLGSKTRVEMLFDHGLPGLNLVPLSSTPRALPRRSDWRFYEVNRQGNEWKEVSATKTLAMRFKHRLIQNPEALPGQRRIVVNFRGKRADLEFALFAVRATA